MSCILSSRLFTTIARFSRHDFGLISHSYGNAVAQIVAGCILIAISKSFFKKMLSADSCLHALLPPERNNEVLSRLRKPTKYPVPFTRKKDTSLPQLFPRPQTKITIKNNFLHKFNICSSAMYKYCQ